MAHDERLVGDLDAGGEGASWEALPVAVYRIDAGGGLIFINSKVHGILGYPPEYWQRSADDAWLRVVHDEDRERVEQEWLEAVESGRPHNTEYRCVHADGHTVWVRELESIVRDDDGRFLWRQGVTLDITAERATQEAMAAALEQQRRVAGFGQQALSGESTARLAEIAAELVSELLAVEVSGVLEVDEDGRLRLVAGRGWPESAVGTVRFPSDPDTQIGHILHSGEPVLVADTELDTRFWISDAALSLGVRSSLGVRVIGPDGPIGIVGALSTRPRTFRPDDASFLQSLANVLGAAHSLQRSESDRRRALDALLRSADEERRRIAVELHDDLIQVMTATLVLLDRQIAALLEVGDAGQAELAVAARRTLAGAVDRTRRLTFELRPPLLESRGLARAVTEMLAEVSTDTGLHAHFDDQIERLPEQVELLAYRTIAELVTNVRKHAAARHMTVSLKAADGTLTGEVSDDGRGFDVEQALDRSATRLHMGLDSTSERLRLAGGLLTVSSQPGAGTRIRFTLPTTIW